MGEARRVSSWDQPAIKVLLWSRWSDCGFRRHRLDSPTKTLYVRRWGNFMPHRVTFTRHHRASVALCSSMGQPDDSHCVTVSHTASHVGITYRGSLCSSMGQLAATMSHTWIPCSSAANAVGNAPCFPLRFRAFVSLRRLLPWIVMFVDGANRLPPSKVSRACGMKDSISTFRAGGA
jgi:hypothetical protein